MPPPASAMSSGSREGIYSAELHKSRRYIAVPGEDAAVSEHRREDDEPGRKMPEEAELPAEALRGERIEIRYPPVVKDERYDAHERDHHKGQAPGERSGEQRRDRDAEEVREGHSGAHHRDSPGLVLLVGKPGGDDRPDSVIGPVREAADEPRDKEPAEALRRDRE